MKKYIRECKKVCECLNYRFVECKPIAPAKKVIKSNLLVTFYTSKGKLKSLNLRELKKRIHIRNFKNKAFDFEKILTHCKEICKSNGMDFEKIEMKNDKILIFFNGQKQEYKFFIKGFE